MRIKVDNRFIKEETLKIRSFLKEKAVLLLEKNKNPLVRRFLLTLIIKTSGNSEKERVELIAEMMEKLEDNKELVHACKLFPSLIVYEKALTKIEENARAKHLKRLGFKSWVDLMKIYLEKVLNTKVDDDLRVKIEQKFKETIREYVEYEYKCGIITEELRRKRVKEVFRFSLAFGSIFSLGGLYLTGIEDSVTFYGLTLYLLYFYATQYVEKIKNLKRDNIDYAIERWLTWPLHKDRIAIITKLL